MIVRVPTNWENVAKLPDRLRKSEKNPEFFQADVGLSGNDRSRTISYLNNVSWSSAQHSVALQPTAPMPTWPACSDLRRPCLISSVHFYTYSSAAYFSAIDVVIDSDGFIIPAKPDEEFQWVGDFQANMDSVSEESHFWRSARLPVRGPHLYHTVVCVLSYL